MSRLIVALLCLLTLPAAHARDSLLDVYHKALQADPQVRAAAAARDAAQEGLPQARAGRLPNANLGADAGQTWQSIGGQSTDFTSYSYQLRLAQPLYDAAVRPAIDQAEAGVARSEAELELVHQSLMLRVSEAYFGILAARDTLEFAQAEQRAIERQLEQAQERFEVGLVAITDVHEARARFDLAQAQVIAAENQLALAREALREIIGEQPDPVAPLAADLPLQRPAEAADQWVDAARTRNPRVTALEQAVASARAEIDRRGAGHRPRVDLVGTQSYSDRALTIPGASPTDRRSTLVGIQLNVPLYQGGAISAAVRQAHHQLATAQEQLEQERRALERESRAAYLNVVAGISQVHALEQAVVSNETALEATQAGFEVGTRTAVEVLNAQQELFRARRDLAQARYQFVLDGLRLKLAAGQLAPEDLEQLDRWLR
ncbi:TolC family outer membrane protein [Ectothiorhodospiraceae bacterium 2226]|nr:TolC family outer membrane protein [Ectothiorhodospiraceae bacterium 2226]